MRLLTSRVGSTRPKPVRGRPEQMVFPTNLYAIKGGGFVKFGIAQNVAKRLKSLQTGCPAKLHVYGKMPAARAIEASVHRYLAAEKAHGEWFNWQGRTIAVAMLTKARDFAGLLELLGDSDLIEKMSRLIMRKDEPTVCRLD